MLPGKRPLRIRFLPHKRCIAPYLPTYQHTQHTQMRELLVLQQENQKLKQRAEVLQNMLNDVDKQVGLCATLHMILMQDGLPAPMRMCLCGRYAHAPLCRTSAPPQHTRTHTHTHTHTHAHARSLS